MPQVKLDDSVTLETGKLAGFRSAATLRDGKTVALLSIEFEVTQDQLGEYTSLLHAKVTGAWDEQKAERWRRFQERTERMKGAGAD